MNGTNEHYGENERLNALMVPYLRGELAPLEAQWVEARLGRSKSLGAQAESLRSALDAARDYAPELDGAHRALLLARLDASRPRGRAPLWLATGLGVSAVALAITFGFLLGRDGAETPVNAATNEKATPFVRAIDFEDEEGLPELTVEAEQRRELTAHLRTVVSKDWVGRVDGSPEDTHVRVEQGTAAFAFRGGEGRRLEVGTEHARVVVVGTRFSVEVSPDGSATTVEVSQGKVEVWRGREKTEVRAGQRARITGARATVRRAKVSDVLDDPYLVALTGERHASTRAKGRGLVRASERQTTRSETGGASPGSPEGRPSPAEGPVDLDAALTALERADALARGGDADAALQAYDFLIASAAPQRIQRMAQLGRARTLGRMGQLRDALRELSGLSQIDGEIGRQARLSRCEVQRRFQPCAAQRCFGALADDPDRALALEAERLHAQSKASGLRCEARE